MKSLLYCACAIIALTSPDILRADDALQIITNVQDLATSVIDECCSNARFDLTAKCIRFDTHMLFFEDESGAMFANWTEQISSPPYSPKPGDLMHLVGRSQRYEGRVRAFCNNAVRLGRSEPTPVRRVSGKEFVSGICDFRLVSVIGTVEGLLPDEIDAQNRFLALRCDNERILVPLWSGSTDIPVGCEVSAVGICTPTPLARRQQISRMLYHTDDDPLSVVRPPRANAFDAPPLKELYRLQPEEIYRLPKRKAAGSVKAVWGQSKALLISTNGIAIKVSFASGNLPAVGDSVEAVGLPETDLYRVNLSHAVWRIAQIPFTCPSSKPIITSASNIVRNVNGQVTFDPDLDGQAIRIRGMVRQLPSSLGLDPRLYLDCDSRLVPIDLTAAPQAANGIPVDSQVEVSGICILETEPWQPNLAFPRITGFTIAIKDANGLVVLSRPPFWTTGRLIGVIAVLAAVLLLILIWNRSLHILATHRGHQLFREKVAHYEASLRVDERTKLAVELHDSLAQSLSGAFMELETAESLGSGANPDMLKHLQIAAATVKSCHGELRNCLWDLRNLSLDEPNLETAIRKTLAPHVRGTDVAVRFNVPRARLSDNTAHAILRIIRELVLNAVRHGKATGVQIAGCIDNGKLLFSVRDNGCGFDPDGCPGVLQGHFGLEGIRERAGLLAGSLELESAPGKGTKASVSIVLPTADTKEQA